MSNADWSSAQIWKFIIKKNKTNIVGHYIYYIYKSNNFGQFSKNAFISHTVVKLKASANLHKILDI